MAYASNVTTLMMLTLVVGLGFSGCFAADKKKPSGTPPLAPTAKAGCAQSCGSCRTADQCTRSKAKCTWDSGSSSCVTIPKCTLPNPMPDGYVASGTGCSGSRIAAECTGLSCNGPTYTGTVTVSCTTNGGIFALSGCSPVVELLCTLPSPVPREYVYDEQSCQGPQTVSTCGGVTCLMPQFEGTVSLTCPIADGLFTLSGCNGVTSICGPGSQSGSSGTLDTGFGGGNYADQLRCVRLIEAPPGMAVSVTFTALCIEECCDFLYLHDGRSLFDPLVGGAPVSGCNLPTTPLVTSQNALLAHFASDTSVNMAGFSFTWTAVAVPVKCSRPSSFPPEYQYTSGCNGVRTAADCSGISCASPNVGIVDISCPSQGGTFQVTGCGPETSICTHVVSTALTGSLTDGFPDPYPDDMFCDRLIQAPARHMISVVFQSFCMETGYDYLTLFDGPDQASPVIMAVTGCEPDWLPGPYHTTQNLLMLWMTSDSSIGYSGFEFTWTSLPIGICDLAQTEVPTGLMDDGSGPGANYANDKDCTRVLQAPEGKFVRVTFSELCTQSSADFVALYDGPTATGTPMAQLSGCEALPVEGLTYSSTGNAMTVRFVSDSSGTAAGFTLTWQFLVLI